MSDLEEFGIVWHGRWLAWGFHHGHVVRPRWLAHAIVTVWNLVACHLDGHEWMPEMVWIAGDVCLSETDEFCPNCCAKRPAPARDAERGTPR